MPQGVVAAVGEPDAIGDENVVVDVGLEPGTKGLHGHDYSGSGFLALVSPVSVATDLGGGPAGKDSVNESPYLALQSGVELKAFAQAHFLGKRDYQVAVVDFASPGTDLVTRRTLGSSECPYGRLRPR